MSGEHGQPLGNLVTTEPPTGRDIDYFGKRTRDPIEIQLSFSIQPAERDRLIRSIVSESPQVKNAADGINPAARIVASVRVIAQPRRAAFVSELTLRNPGQPQDKGTKLLSVPNEAATELIDKALGSSRATRQASTLENFAQQVDPEDWGRIREGVRETNIPLYRMMAHRTQELDRETGDKLDAIVRQSESIADFRRAVAALVAISRQEAEKALSESLKNKIGTFAGEETAIPRYVLYCVKTHSPQAATLSA